MHNESDTNNKYAYTTVHTTFTPRTEPSSEPNQKMEGKLAREREREREGGEIQETKRATARDERATYRYTTMYTSSLVALPDSADNQRTKTDGGARPRPYPGASARDDERPGDPTVSQDPSEAVVVQILYTGVMGHFVRGRRWWWCIRMVRRARASRRGHSVVEYVGVKVQHSGGRVG